MSPFKDTMHLHLGNDGIPSISFKRYHVPTYINGYNVPTFRNIVSLCSETHCPQFGRLCAAFRKTLCPQMWKQGIRKRRQNGAKFGHMELLNAISRRYPKCRHIIFLHAR